MAVIRDMIIIKRARRTKLGDTGQDESDFRVCWWGLGDLEENKN